MQIAARNGDEWSDLLTDTFSVPLAVNRVAPDFHASLVHLELSADVSVTEISATGCRMARTPRLLRTTPRDDLFFVMLLDGDGVIRQHDRQATTRSGEGAFYDASQPYDLNFGASRGLVFQLARTAVLDRPNDPMPTAVHMPATMPTMRVLRAAMGELFTAADELEFDAAQTMGTVVADLLRAAMTSNRDGGVVDPTGRPALVRALKTTIAENLSEPGLSPAYLAARHHLSLRYVQALFTETGTSPAAYIREQRLLAAYRQLGAVRHAYLPIAAVAAGAGFADVSTFTRAFRRRFDCTPTDRRSHRSGQGQRQ